MRGQNRTFKSALLAVACATAFMSGAGAMADAVEAERHWPQWRGPGLTGAAAPAADPPIEWSETKNLRWKVKLPGAGSSTPIIWGDRIFIQTAVPAGDAPA